MSNYSADESMVRVDFFKPSGKWYTTEAVRWTGEYRGGCIIESFHKTLIYHLGGRLEGATAVCLHPFHENSHPIMVVVEG